jgi:hypothetical protein
MGNGKSGRGKPFDWRINLAEGTAAATSLLCLVHCLALPVLLLVLPAALATYAVAESFHWLILAGLVPFAVAVFWLGYRQHGSFRPVVAGLSGIICLGLALVPDFPLGTEVALTVVGSVLLLAGHLGNWRLRANVT